MIRGIALLILALAFTMYGASGLLAKPGYLLDEEITTAVAPSISEHAVPRLPSGILYVRGLPFSYAAWLAGLAFGDTLTVYRAVGFVFAVIAVLAIFRAGWVVAGPLTGGAAAVILAFLSTFTAAAAFARPYSMFVAAFAVTIGLLVGALDRRRSPWPFLVGLAACRLLHEFGAVLTCLPLILALLLEPGDERRSRLLRLWWVAAGVMVALELVLFASVRFSVGQLFIPMTNAPAFRPLRVPPRPPLHLFEVATAVSFLALIAAPLVAVAVVLGRRTKAWLMVTASVVLAATFQLGLLVVLVVAAVLFRPARVRHFLTIGAAFLAVSVAVWIVHTFAMSSMAPSLAHAWALPAPMLQYPLAALQNFAAGELATTVALAVALVSLSASVQTRSTLALRSLALFSLTTFVGFGVFSLAAQPRFLLLAFPALALVAAHGLVSLCDGAAALAARLSGVRPAVASGSALALALAGAAWLNSNRPEEAPRLTSIAPQIALAANDVVICTEELACRHLLGRIDYLLLAVETDLAYYTGIRGGGPRGLYANSPVLSSAQALEAVVRSAASYARVVVIVFDTGKVYELECLEIVRQVAARLGERGYQTDGAEVFYLSRNAAGTPSLSSIGHGDRRLTTASISSR